MTKLFYRFILAFIISISFIVCGIGCTSDEENDPVTSTSASEIPNIKDEKTTTKAEESIENSGDGTPPAEFVLVSKLWQTHTKGAPNFTHEKHIKTHKIECDECHHIYEDEKNIWKVDMPVEKCEKCHNDPTIKGEKKLEPDIQKKNLKLAFHNNCKVCHKTLKKEKPETKAPVTCKQCHPKK